MAKFIIVRDLQTIDHYLNTDWIVEFFRTNDAAGQQFTRIVLGIVANNFQRVVDTSASPESLAKLMAG